MKTAELTQKLMDLQFDLKYLKDVKEIARVKEEIMWTIAEINIIEKENI